MENCDLLRRAEDLRDRCERRGLVTATGFLTPAERAVLTRWGENRLNCRLIFNGGHPECERTVCFFLPDDLEEEWLPIEESIRAFELTAAFGSPGHRDYLGALLGMGVRRDCVGDIWVKDNTATVFCLAGIEKHLLSIDRAGRYTVRAKSLQLTDLTGPERKVKKKSFSVQSLRLDAAAAGLFDLSRTEAARQVAAGNVFLNYEVCEKPDAVVGEGDILSVRGRGKGRICSLGGSSRKGRQFVNGEIWLS